MTTKRQRLLEAIKGNPAMVERLLMVAEPGNGPTVYAPEAAFEIFAPLIAGKAVEHLAVIALDRRNKVLATEILTIGSDGFTVVDPRQIYRWALLQGTSGACSIILGHNHPSGDPTPSKQDVEVTARVRKAGEVIGIKLMDHIVVAGHTFRRVED